MNDLISRQAAIDVLEERIKANNYTNVSLVSELNRSIGYLLQIPSAQVNLQPTCNQLATDCISRQATINSLLDEGLITAAVYVSKQPSADVPERKVGKWLPGSTDFAGQIRTMSIKCSCCGKESIKLFSTNGLFWDIEMIYDFCPKCGADMRERNENDND